MTDPGLTQWAAAHARTAGRRGTAVAVPLSTSDLSLVEAATWSLGSEVIRSMAWRLAADEATLAFADGRTVGTLDGVTGQVRASWPRSESMICWADDRILSATADSAVLSSPFGAATDVGYAVTEPGIMSIAYEPGRKLIATGHQSNVVNVWEPPGGRGMPFSSMRILQGHTDWVTAVAWSSTGMLASGGADGTVRLWDVRGRGPLRILEHGAWVSDIAFAELAGGAQLMATVGNDGSARVWEPVSGELVHVLDGQIAKLSSAAWVVLPDGRPLLAACGMHGTVRVWDGRTGKAVAETAHLGGILHDVVWGRTPDGQIVLAAAGVTGGIRTFRVTGPAARPPVPALEAVSVSGTAQAPGSPLPPVVLPRGLVAHMTKDGDVQITKRDTGTVQCVLTGHKSLVRAVDEQIDGNGRLLIATGDWDGQACVWDGESGEQVTEFHAGPLRIRSIALTALPGGRILVAACSDSQIEIWDETNESRPIRLPLMIHPAISAVAWGLLPHGRALLGVAAGRAGVLLDDGGNPVVELVGGSAFAVAVTAQADGQAMFAVAGGDGNVRLWDESKDQVTQVAAGHGALHAVSWAALPDGRLLLAAAASAGNVVIWDGLTGSRLTDLTVDRGTLLSLRSLVEPDGKVQLAVGGFGGTSVLDLTVSPPVKTTPAARQPAPEDAGAPRRPVPGPAALGLLRLGAGDLWPALGLVTDLLTLTGRRGGGEFNDPRLQPLERHPGVVRLQTLDWPAAARMAFVALLTADLSADPAYVPPAAELRDMQNALDQAMDTEPLQPARTAADLDELSRAIEAVDDRTTAMLSLIGPAAAAEEPLLALRLRHHVASLPALSQRQLRLLAYRSQSERRPRHSGGTPRHTPGTAGVVRHGPLSHLLHTDLALPADVIALRRLENELLYRRHVAPQPPLPRPLALVLDTTPPTYGPAEQALRLAAHVLTIASWEFGLEPTLITLGEPEQQLALAGLRELLHLWTIRTLVAPAPVLEKALVTAVHTGRTTVVLAHQHTPGRRQLPGPGCPFVTVRHPTEPPRRHPAHPHWHDLSPEPGEAELAALVTAVLLQGQVS